MIGKNSQVALEKNQEGELQASWIHELYMSTLSPFHRSDQSKKHENELLEIDFWGQF